MCYMSTINVRIEENLKKWLRDVADESMVFGNMSDVALYCIRYVKENPGVLPK